MSANHTLSGFLLQKKDTTIHLIGIKQELLLEVLTQPLSIIYQQSWLIREVSVDWKLPNVMPMYKKSQKEDLGNYRPVSLTSVPEKVMEHIILHAPTLILVGSFQLQIYCDSDSICRTTYRGSGLA